MKKIKGFFRIFSLCFVALLACSLAGGLQVVSASDPPAEHRYAASGTAYSAGDSGTVSDANRVELEYDNNYATMHTSYQYNTAIIVAEMSGWSVGEVWVRCSNYEGPESGLIVWAYDIMNQEWKHIGNIGIGSSSILVWRDINAETEPGQTAPPGYAPFPFKTIALSCISPTDQDNNHIRVDAIAAETTEFVAEVHAYDDMGTNPGIGFWFGSATSGHIAYPSGLLVPASVGSNYFEVMQYTDYGYYYYTFDYMTIDGTVYYSPPSSIDVYSDRPVINLYYNFHWWY